MKGANERPKGWEYVTLGSLFIIERGGSPRPIEEYITEAEDGINWIKIGDTKGVTKYIYKTKEKIKPEGLYKSRMVYEDDFILSNSMSFGHPYIMKTRGCIHDGWLVIRINKEIIDTNFLYYILSSSFVYQQFSNLAKGSTVKNLNIEAVQQVYIFLPPLPEQRRIVAKIEELFSSLDKGIESLKTAQQQLKTYRQAVLKWAFEGKDNCCFRELIETSQNGISKRSSFIGEKFKVLRLADINNTRINITSPRFIKLNKSEILKYQIQENDLLCIRVNGSKDLVGSLIYVNKNDEDNKWGFCDHFIRFTLKSDKANAKFYYFFFKTVEIRKYIHDNMVTSAGQNTVSQGTIKNITVPICPLSKQKIIVSEIETRLSVCDKIEESIIQSLQQAEALRQSILKKAFEGKLVPQDPKDEPASKLLERIRAEREKNKPEKKKMRSER